MRLKLTIFLGILNLLAFGAIYYFETNGESDGAPERAAPILPSSITQSTRIEISGELIPERRVLRRVDEAWQLEEPVVWRANPNAIDRLFRSLLFLRKDVRFTMEDIERNNQSLSDYGLDAPILSLTFYRGEDSTSIKVGAPTEVGDRFYLLGPSENEVFVVDKELLRSVALDLQELRGQNLFAMDFFSVKEITIQPGKGRNLQIRLAAVEDGWTIESPIQTRASAAAVDSRLQSILSTPVESLEPESQISPSESGLVEPRMRISIENGDSRSMFLLGGEVPGQEGTAYGKLEGIPTVVTVPSAPFLRMDDALSSLREKSFFLFNASEASSIQISSGPRMVTLQKLENESWQVSASGDEIDPVRFPADPTVLRQTLESLITLRAVRFVSDAPSDSDLEQYGLDEPQRTVEIIGGGNHKLILGDLDPETKLIYAQVEGEPFVYAVPLQVIRSLPVSALAYRFRTLNRVPENGRIKTVSVTDLETGEVLLSREIGADGDSWTTDAPEGNNILTEKAFGVILDQIREFKVESYLSDQFQDGLILEADRIIPWRYSLQASLELPGSGESTLIERQYFLTSRIEGTLQGGGSEELETTFILPPEIIEAWTELFPPRPLPEEYDVEEAQTILLESEADEIDSPNPQPSAAPEDTPVDEDSPGQGG